MGLTSSFRPRFAFHTDDLHSDAYRDTIFPTTGDSQLTLFSAKQVRGLFVAVVSVRIIALLLTFYAIDFNPLRFYERNPTTSPIFGTFGSLGGTIFYTVILLVAMLMLYDSVAKTHPRFYTIIFVMYYAILFESTLDLLNDFLIVFSLSAYYVDAVTVSAIVLIQIFGAVAGHDLLRGRMKNFTLGQKFAMAVLLWPALLYAKVFRVRSGGTG